MQIAAEMPLARFAYEAQISPAVHFGKVAAAATVAFGEPFRKFAGRGERLRLAICDILAPFAAPPAPLRTLFVFNCVFRAGGVPRFGPKSESRMNVVTSHAIATSDGRRRIRFGNEAKYSCFPLCILLHRVVRAV